MPHSGFLDMAATTGSLGKANEDVYWGKRFLIIITGASRGIGRAIAIGFARQVTEGSLIVITGRNTAGLEETKRLVEDVAPGVEVVTETLDHSKASFKDHRDLVSRSSKRVKKPERVVLVHNTATLGDIGKYARSCSSDAEVDDYFRLNLTSSITLTAAFLQEYGTDSGVSRTIVNVTSSAAIAPYPGLWLYCTGKAAREMFFKVVALENPSLSVLSYTPGPVDTSLFSQLEGGVKEIAAVARDKVKKGELQKPETTVERLVDILRMQEFQSGDHVHF